MAVSLGCKAQTTIVDSFVYGGLMRTYRLYVPAVYTGANPVPVVLNLHGYTSNGLQQESYGDFRPIADTANFIIAHPDGAIDAFNNRAWNLLGVSPVDDIGFLSALLDTIIAHYNINLNRLYSTGLSNGGYMSYLLACSMGHRIAAIASVTGAMTADMKLACAPAHPTPVMEIHGTADLVVPYTGGNANLPVDTTILYWVSYNHCNPLPVVTTLPDVAVNDGCTAEHAVYQGGDNGSSVELYKIVGGGHTWPGAPLAIGVTNMDFSASREIWRFFNQYSLNNLVTFQADELKSESGEVLIYPNPSAKGVTIQFNNAAERNLALYNNMGVLITEIKTHSQKYELDLMKGFYFLRIEEGSKYAVRKLLIQ